MTLIKDIENKGDIQTRKYVLKATNNYDEKVEKNYQQILF